MPKIEDRVRPGEQGMPYLPDPPPSIPTSRVPTELSDAWEALFGPSNPPQWPPASGASMPVPPQPEETTELGKQIKKDMDLGVGLATPFGMKNKLEMLKSVGEKLLPLGEWKYKEEEEKKRAKEPWKDLDSVLEGGAFGRNLKGKE